MKRWSSLYLFATILISNSLAAMKPAPTISLDEYEKRCIALESTIRDPALKNLNFPLLEALTTISAMLNHINTARSYQQEYYTLQIRSIDELEALQTQHFNHVDSTTITTQLTSLKDTFTIKKEQLSKQINQEKTALLEKNELLIIQLQTAVRNQHLSNRK